MTTPPPVVRTSRTRLHRFALVGLVVLGFVMVVVLKAWLLYPSLAIPSDRLVGWSLRGFFGHFDATTAQTTTVVPIYFASWPTEPDGDTWLATPVVTYTPWSVTITMQFSDSYDCHTLMQRCGWYDTGGSVKVQLNQPLGGRALFDGSKFPPEARPYP